MKLFEQKTVWLHGSRFLVRRVQSRSHGHYNNFTHTYTPGVPEPPYAVFYQGRFLARIEHEQLKRWLNYYARRLLTLGHT